MKILFVNPDSRHTCSFYRSAGIARNLRNQLGSDFTLDVASWANVDISWSGIGDYDMIMFQRPWSKPMAKFCGHVKEMGAKLWLDFDDNLFTVGPENKAFQIFGNPEVQDSVKEMIQIADVLSVTTEDLKNDLAKLNDNIVVIPNAFNDGIFDVNRKLEERDNTVLWRGSDTHIYDMMTNAPAITKCTEEHPEWEFTYVGYNPWFLPASKNIKFVRSMDVIDFFNTVFDMKPGVVHIPLNDTNFNRCKSNIAFIEAAYWGAVALVPEWWGEIPGTIPYSDNDSYYEGLTSLLNGTVDLEAMNKLAWNYVKKNLLLSDVNKLRVDVIKKTL